MSGNEAAVADPQTESLSRSSWIAPIALGHDDLTKTRHEIASFCAFGSRNGERPQRNWGAGHHQRGKEAAGGGCLALSDGAGPERGIGELCAAGGGPIVALSSRHAGGSR